MSLVCFKNLLVGRGRGTRATSREAAEPAVPMELGGLGSQASTAINSNVENVDLESQVSQDAAQDVAPVSRVWRFKLDGRVVSDATLGLTDGLTVPFALTAGLSALGNTRVVIFGGLAEVIAGSISMGLSGYLGAKSEVASYNVTRDETQELADRDPAAVIANVRAAFAAYDVPAVTLDQLTKHLASSPRLVDFAVRFQQGAAEPSSSRAIISGVTIAMGYFVGGMLPLMPYFFVGQQELLKGLYISIAVMVVVLFLFGYGKTCAVSGWRKKGSVRKGIWGGVQMLIVGSLAAGAAWGLLKAFYHAVGPTTV